MASDRFEETRVQRGVARGFTLLEMMVTVAIIGILAALAYSSYAPARARSQMASATLEVQGAIQAGRAKALSTGRDVVVLFYPGASTAEGGFGRVIVYLDGSGGFIDGTGAVNFDNFDPAAVSGGNLTGGNEILAVVNFPEGVSFGQPRVRPVLGFPYTAVTDADVTTGCNFCDRALDAANFASAKGAIRFDARGQATFFPACGPPLDVRGGTVAIVARTSPAATFGPPEYTSVRGASVIVVLPSGLVRTFHAG